MDCLRKNWSYLGIGLLIGLGSLIAVTLEAATVRVSWIANTEPDLAGYIIYYGETQPGVYSVILDVGNVTSRDISGLTIGATYYFAVTAYDSNNNESEKSVEYAFLIQDVFPPDVVLVVCELVDQIRVVFDEPVEKTSAEIAGNYTISNPSVVVQNAILQADLKTVILNTTQHVNGSYTLTINNVRDRASVPNTITPNTQKNYVWDKSDDIPPTVENAKLYQNNFLVITFSEPVNSSHAMNNANYSISPSIAIQSATINDAHTNAYLETGVHSFGQTYTVTVSNVSDVAGNVMNASKQYEWIAEDSDPPTLMAARIRSATELELEFNEALDRLTAEDNAHYSISPSVTVQNASLSQSGTIVTITTVAHTANTYTITVSGITDDANPPNQLTSAQLPYTYTPPDHTPPTLVSAEIPSNDLLVLTFSEPLDQTSATLLTNYAIDPPVEIGSAALDANKVIVRLFTQEHTAGDYRITVNNVKDDADTPNTIQANSYLDYSYNPPDNEPPQIVTVTLHGANVLEVEFDEPLDKTTSQDISNYQIDPTVAVTMASLVGELQNKVYLTTEDHQPGENYTLTVQSVRDRAQVPNAVPSGTKIEYDFPATDTASPFIVSCDLEGTQLLKVVFNEPLDEVSSKNIANYAIIPSITIQEATLDESYQIVFLTTSTHTPGTEYHISVQSVLDRAKPGNIMASGAVKAYTCTAEDNISPRLDRTELLSNNVLELVFSEAVESASASNIYNYAIDNGINVLLARLSRSQKEIHLTTTPHHSGYYTVTVNNVKDLAPTPNAILPNSKGIYNYTEIDTVRPQLVNVEARDPNLIQLDFNEILEPASAKNKNNYSIDNGIIINNVILTDTRKSVLLQTSEHIEGYYTVTVNDVKDGSENLNAIEANTKETYTIITEDHDPPTIQFVRINNENMVSVTFSESVDSASAVNPSNYLINKNIEIQDVYFTANNQVILETSTHAAGEYIITINSVKDDSPAKNSIEDYAKASYIWSPEDNEAPQLLSGELLNTNFLILTFDEALRKEEVEITTNYEIDPYIDIYYAYLHDGNKVNLHTADHEVRDYTVTVKNVKDCAFEPNEIDDKNTSYYRYTPPDITPPKLISPKLRTHMSLALVFDEELDRASAEDVSNYVITPEILITEASLQGNRTEVRLETAAHQPGNYTIQITGVKDRAPSPNAVAIEQPIVGQYIYTPEDTERPTLNYAKLWNTNLLELIFSEEVDQKSAERIENYRIDPYIEIRSAVLQIDNPMKVRLETGHHIPGVLYSINVRDVKDRAAVGNTIADDTWCDYSMPTAGGLADTQSPVVSRINPIAPTKIQVVFSEPVNPSTAENIENYKIQKYEDGAVVSELEIQLVQISDDNNMRIELQTETHALCERYSLLVSNILDSAPTPNMIASDAPIQYLITEDASVSNINQNDYTFSLIYNGIAAATYTDRDYEFCNIPECLENAIQIQTSNADKNSTGNSFMSFELHGEATIYVGYDSRIATLPGWLANNFEVTGEQIMNNRNDIYNLYSNVVKEGRIVLGGNYGGPEDNMYTVFVTPNIRKASVLANMSQAAYQLEYLGVGDTYYIDRDYTIAMLPMELKDCLWIKTRNDHKESYQSDFLKFTLNNPATLYIAYDSRIIPRASWLDDTWTLFKNKDDDPHRIVDSRGTIFYVYYKDFEKDADVELGGNQGTLDDNMYTALIAPSSVLPGYFRLYQNYPNPFNPTTNIEFEVHKTGRVQLIVYNILGQKVKMLRDETIVASKQRMHVIWDGLNDYGNPVASGIYICRIQQGNFAIARRMLLLK